MKILNTTEALALTASNKPIMIDFYADWCGPCKMLAPVVEELSQVYEGRVEIVKVNVDDSRELAMEYGVMSIPTMIGFKDGNKVVQEVGFMPKSMIEEKLQELL
ncbi:MAG: thioredoxin [Erysipelotrichales bacterium]|nr:thioredoxin [Erysipelotrichales bacterium]